MKNHTLWIYWASALLFLTAILMHGQNLITNGSFETYLKPAEQWTNGAAIGDHGIPVGDTKLEGWTVIQCNLDYVSGGSVSSYVLTFDLSVNPDQDQPIKTLLTSIEGAI